MAARCQRSRAIRWITWTSSLSFTLAVLLLAPRGDARAETFTDLGDLSIEALMQVEVTSAAARRAGLGISSRLLRPAKRVSDDRDSR